MAIVALGTGYRSLRTTRARVVRVHLKWNSSRGNLLSVRGGGGDISGGNVSRDSEGRYRLGTSNLGPATRRCMDAG